MKAKYTRDAISATFICLMLLNVACKQTTSLSEVQDSIVNNKIQTLDSSKVEFQYYSGQPPTQHSSGLDPAQISAGKDQMASVIILAFESARQAWADNMPGYTISFAKNNYGIQIDKIKMVEKERVAFAVDGSIAIGKGSTGESDIGTALLNAGFNMTGFMSRYTMHISAIMRNSDEDTLFMSLEQDENFDFWQNTLSVSASSKFDGATILGAFLKSSPAVINKFLPMLNSLAEAKGGARLDTMEVNLSQFRKIVFPINWKSPIPYASYLIAKRVFEKICLANTSNDIARCTVPGLQKIAGTNEIRSLKAATQTSLLNYAVSPAMICKKVPNNNFEVFVAIPSDGTQDIGFQNGQKVYFYKANGNQWTKTGEFGTASIQSQPRSSCPRLSDSEKCIKIHQTAGFMSKFGSFCDKIKVDSVKSKAIYGYSSLPKLDGAEEEVKNRF